MYADTKLDLEQTKTDLASISHKFYKIEFTEIKSYFVSANIATLDQVKTDLQNLITRYGNLI